MIARRASVPSGFTLVEVIVVLVILALTAAAATPAFRAAGHLDEAHEARSAVTAVLERARGAALARARDVTLDVDPAALRVWQSAPDTLVHVELPASCSLHASRERVRFIFRADGSAAGETLALKCASAEFAISLDPLTGAIQVLGVR